MKHWIRLLCLTLLAVVAGSASAQNVAKIGSTEYATLQAAVDAAQASGGAQTITLMADVSGESVTIQEVANFQLTIDGQNYTYNGQIIVDGLRGNSTLSGSPSNGASVTLKNFAFANVAAKDLITASHYPHHLTIQDCTYQGSSTSSNKWFLNVSDGPLYGATVKNVTVKSSRLIQGDLSSEVVFENIVATDNITAGFNIKTGASGGYTGSVLIKNCEVTTGKYAFRDYTDGYNGTITLEGNTFVSTSIESDEGAIVNRGGAVGTAHINVLSGTYTGDVKVLNGKEGVLAISGGYFSEEIPQDYIAADLVAQGKVCIPATDKEGFYTVGDPLPVAQYGETKYPTLQEALDAAEAADDPTIVITLLGDATLDITAWDGAKNALSIGTVNTQSITINGNNHTLTFNKKNSDWNNIATMNDAVTKLILNDMTITGSGYDNGPWNRHDLNFNCDVTLNNVTSDHALAFKNDATLNNVTITDTGSVYGIWIQPNGQTVSIDGLNLTAERGIKIDQQYVDNPQLVNLSIDNAKFNTTKKAAVLVLSSAGANITAGANNNIENVAADNTNLVWVDEAKADEFYKVNVTGATVVPESKESDYVAKIVNGDKTVGYFNTVADAVAAIDKQTYTDSKENWSVVMLKAGSYTLPNLPYNMTVEGAVDGVVFNHTTAGSIASIPNGATFKNVAFEVANVNYHGFQHAGTINMENCTINGKLFSYGDMNFTNCSFNQSNSDYHMWAYSGNLTYTGCSFTNSVTGKFLNVYNEDGTTKYTVTAADCKFINKASSANKAALNVKATSGAKVLAYDVIINNCTTEGAFPEVSMTDALYVLNNLVQVDDRTATGVDNITVTQDGVLIYPVDYVAAIGNKRYETLEAAFAAAQDGETITLLADCTGNGIKAPQGKFATGLTVDFAGFTYTVDGETVGSTGTETNGFQLLKDNKITFKNGTITSEKAKILVQNYSDLTLEGMTLTLNNAGYTSAYTLSNNNGTVVIDGSTINANPAGGFAFDVCRYSSYPSVNVTVKGESVINGNVEVSASGSDAKDGFGLMFEAGTFNGKIVLDATAKTAMANTPEKAKVSKNNDLTEIAAPTDYKWVDNGDGTSTLAPCEYVAQIGETKYETLEAAFAAAQDGETITLLADCTGNGIKAPQGKFSTGLTVDFAGFTYTVDGSTVGSTGTETNGFQLLKDNKITFKNGTITSEKAKILVQNYSDLTLEGMTLTLNNAGYTSAYTLSNNNGSVVIDGSTINANPAGGFAFDVCRYSSYPSVNVTVKGESVINGNVEVYASGSDAKDGFGLMFEAGTLSGEIVLDATAKTAMANTPEKAKVSKNNDLTEIAAPTDYKWVDNGDGTSTLAPCEYIAAIGSTKYETLQAAVDAAGTSAATITLLTEAATEGVITGNGVKVQNGQDITFDLNGLTYNVDKTVGSTGTETNGFQLLKGSTVKFTNGTVTSSTAQILLQNYSDLTLQDVTIEAGSADYAVSNNFGSMTATGNTVINAKNGGMAFDLWYGMSAVYDDGIKVTFDENFTGEVKGKVEYGHANRVTDENWQEKAALEIKCGNEGKFDIEFANASANALDGANIQISGGVFSEEPAEEYLAEGYVASDNEDEETKATYPYAVMTKEDAGIFELYDLLASNTSHVPQKTIYTFEEDKAAKQVTYYREFSTNTAGHRQCWFVPFDYTITEADLEKCTFYRIHMFAADSDEDGVVQDENSVVMKIAQLTAGYTLKANKPYIIKPKAAGVIEFKAEDVTLKAKNENKLLTVATSVNDYNFFGVYDSYGPTAANEWFSLNNNGNLKWNGANQKLGPYRWYIKPTYTGDDYANIAFIVDEESEGEETTEIASIISDPDAEIEGFYTVGGVKHDKPIRGTLNIVKYTDGRTKKVYVK